jgi:PrtD family type I secretion system ABC transporter
LRGPLAAAIRSCLRHMVFAGVFSALLNLLYLAPTLYMLQVYDRVVPSRGKVTLVLLTLGVLSALAVLALLDLARSRILVRAGVRLEKHLAAAVLDAGFARAAGPSRDALVNRAMRDFDVMRQSLTGPAILALFDAPWSPLYILVSFAIHPWLGALSLGGAVILYGMAAANEAWTGERLRTASAATNTAYLSQQYSAANAEIIRALGMRQSMVRRHITEREQASQLQLGASLTGSGVNAASRFVRLGLQSMALGLAAYLAIEQKISVGAIFAASLLMGRALAPIEQLLSAWRGLGQARDAYRSLSEILRQTESAGPTTGLPRPSGGIQVERLSVSNAAQPGLILNDLSFAIARGEVVGVIGPSGAGKTTLARMLALGDRPDTGIIRFDGADARQWSQERLARWIGYMPQQTVLFGGTIRQNIARFSDLTTDNADEIDAAVLEAARSAGAHDLIVHLPQGYDTMLGWGGRGLAAGHAQRIALARALFGNPDLLILDEPNAHLDAEGESTLATAILDAKQRGCTTVVIAHRTGVLATVDRLMVMRNGRIELFGPRDEVIARMSQAPAGAPRTPAVRGNTPR